MSVAGIAGAQDDAKHESGDLIVAECTDPLTAIDIPNPLRQTGDTLESKTEAEGVLSFRIRKK